MCWQSLVALVTTASGARAKHLRQNLRIDPALSTQDYRGISTTVPVTRSAFLNWDALNFDMPLAVGARIARLNSLHRFAREEVSAQLIERGVRRPHQSERPLTDRTQFEQASDKVDHKRTGLARPTTSRQSSIG